MEAVLAGADVILNACSSVGEVANLAKPLGKYIGVPIVRIDQEMCYEAIRQGKRIGLLATLSTTLEPTKQTLRDAARELGKEVELVDGLVEGAFNVEQNIFKEMLCAKAREIVNQVDVIVLCQGSMAYARQAVQEAIGKPVLASPAFGAMALKATLEKQGKLGGVKC